jgi:hypothetical protein
MTMGEFSSSSQPASITIAITARHQMPILFRTGQSMPKKITPCRKWLNAYQSMRCCELCCEFTSHVLIHQCPQLHHHTRPLRLSRITITPATIPIVTTGPHIVPRLVNKSVMPAKLSDPRARRNNDQNSRKRLSIRRGSHKMRPEAIFSLDENPNS